MPHEWEIGPGATASVTDDLRFIVETHGPGAYRVEELLMQEILRLTEERDKLEAENAKLRYAESRLTSLRLEVDRRGERIAHLETLIRGHETNTRLFRARIDALIAEARNLRIDLAAAIKTGEEQASRIKGHDDAWAIDQRIKRNLMERIATLDLRLSRLDALLASEQVPAGLWNAAAPWPCLEHGNIVTAAWRWFREQLDATHHMPPGDPA